MSEQEAPHLLVEETDGILIATLNRPDKLNAITGEMMGLFGVLPASSGVSRLSRLCGPHWARLLIMANQRADAEKAMYMGLVHEVFPDETFEEEVMTFCRHLAKQNGEQMGAAKIAIELAYEVGRDQARHVERLTNSALMLSPDYQEGFKRYLGGVGSVDDKA